MKTNLQKHAYASGDLMTVLQIARDSFGNDSMLHIIENEIVLDNEQMEKIKNGLDRLLSNLTCTVEDVIDVLTEE